MAKQASAARDSATAHACISGAHPRSPVLSPEDVRLLLRSKDKPFLLDVRERDEFAEEGHVKGSVNIPLGTVVAGVQDARIPRGKVIVLICAHGHRAGRAASELAARGYVTAVLGGGFTAWQEE